MAGWTVGGESGWLVVAGAGTKYERNQTIRINEKTIIQKILIANKYYLMV